jgi:hypothetical protein
LMLGLIGHSGQDFDITDVTLAILPARGAEETISLCVQSHGHGVIFEDDLVIAP